MVKPVAALGSGANTAVLSKYISLPRYWGKRPEPGDASFRCSSSSDTATPLRLALWVGASDAATDYGSIDVITRLVYYCVFSEPRKPPDV